MSTVIIRPEGNGSSNLWVKSGAATNWECVKEATSDDDTTYVSTFTVRDDFYAMPAVTGLIPTGSVINSVTLYGYMRHEGTACNVRLVVNYPGLGSWTSADKALTGSYALYSDVRTTDPSTGNAWTAANLDNVQFGVRSMSTGPYARLTQFYAEIDYTEPAAKLFGFIMG